jgi:hypothetical protein
MWKGIEAVAPVAGLAGIAMMVLLLLYREVIRKAIFPQLGKKQAYRLLTLIVVLISVVVLAAIGAWVYKDTLPAAPKRMVLQLSGDNDVIRTEVVAQSIVRPNPSQTHCPAQLTYGSFFEAFEPYVAKNVIVVGRPGAMVPIQIKFTGGLVRQPPEGEKWACHAVFEVEGPK